MSNKVIKSKFQVNSITRTSGSGRVYIMLNPVLTDDVENKKMWKSTPTGTVELHLDNPDSYNNFQVDEIYELTFKQV